MVKTRVVTARLDEQTAQRLDELVEMYSEHSLEPVNPSQVLRKAIFSLWLSAKQEQNRDEAQARHRDTRTSRTKGKQ